MQLTSASKLNALRAAIYQAAGVAHYSKSYRSRKLRKVCAYARGLDLRRRTDVVLLAQHLGIIAKSGPVQLVEVDLELSRLAQRAIAAMQRTDATLTAMKAVVA